MASDDLLSFKSRLCLLGLGRLTSQLRKPDCRFLDQIPLLGVEDDAHRFRLWGGNIGAFQDPEKRSSLDARLKDAPQVRRQISRLLDRLSAASDQGWSASYIARCSHTSMNPSTTYVRRVFQAGSGYRFTISRDRYKDALSNKQ